MVAPRAVAVILLLGFVACGTGDEAEHDASPPLTWEMRVVERSEGECDPTGVGACAKFRCEYPEITGGPDGAMERLNPCSGFITSSFWKWRATATWILPSFCSTRKPRSACASSTTWSMMRLRMRSRSISVLIAAAMRWSRSWASSTAHS